MRLLFCRAGRAAVSTRCTSNRSFSTFSSLSTSTSTSTGTSTAIPFNAPGARPLDGVTVVALEQVISGPYCSRQLADLGARVIKIERPGTGDFIRYHDKRVKGSLCSHFVWTNRNKESLELDVKQAKDVRILKKLLSKADVFLHNLVPGAVERLGLGFDAVHALNERLIVCQISGYGSDSSTSSKTETPYSKKKAYDLLVQAEAGLLSITGTPDQPCKVGASIADIAAAMYAYSGILAALLQRNKTGKGCLLDISMLESLTEWMGFPLYYAMDSQPPPARAGASHSSIYPYGPFEIGASAATKTETGTGTGTDTNTKPAAPATVMLGLQNEREWAILCGDKVLNMPELVSDPRFIDNASRSKAENRTALYEIICKAFRAKFATVEEAIRRLDEAGIANGILRDMHGVWEHPQLQARKRWREVQVENGAVVPSLIIPGMAADVEPRLDPVPSVGQHTQSILAELEKD